MPASLLEILIAWLIVLAIFFGFIVFLRSLQHREHMAMISSGMHPNSFQRQRRSAGLLRAGLIIAMVGFTLTIGLYPLGFILPPTYATAPWHLGPWLLPGLIPLGVGVALITSYYLERDVPPPDTDNKVPAARVKEAIEDRHSEEI
jgi:formate hydrogenlyase subunit 3/multisubunit Na+/H+ antiporter MnhD subunit